MNDLGKSPATLGEISGDSAGQRIDNFLLKTLKGVPKSHIYQILRTGQVRVNSLRVDAAYRLKQGDRLRLPPVRAAAGNAERAAPSGLGLAKAVLFEDDYLMALNKPAGLAVHGGSGISLGAIEQLRLELPGLRFLELVHRLDRDTSGLLLLAKKRTTLLALHELLRAGLVDKRYLALVRGQWSNPRQAVTAPLHKFLTPQGERRVAVSAGGRPARSVFRLVRTWERFSLVEAQLKTGRTHQIRVHLAHLNYPIAGDGKYGDLALNRELARAGFARMFLHAAKLGFIHPITGETLRLEAPLHEELRRFLSSLDRADSRPHQ
jgi:23S rRNA pseudouridine955/2504/2580 synthase